MLTSNIAISEYSKLKTWCVCLMFLGLFNVSQAETFEEALISAYNSHPELLAERARLKEIDETYIQARAQGRLSSDINANTGLSKAEATQISFLGSPNKTSVDLRPQ